MTALDAIQVLLLVAQVLAATAVLYALYLRRRHPEWFGPGGWFK